MQDFRELKVWQKAHALTLAVYRLTARFPREQLYGITSQIRRATASIPANLAEGRCRRSDRDFGRFVGIALGSASESSTTFCSRATSALPMENSTHSSRRAFAKCSKCCRAAMIA